jgi:hypothetical protein
MPGTSSVANTTVASALVAFAIVTTACGTPATRPDAAGFGAPSPGDVARSGAHVMTAADFSRASDAPNALAAIERLRPLFLRPRPSFGSLRGQAPVISVFINGAYAGGPDALRVIGADAVSSARYLQPTEAITTLGARYAGDGVIMVQLKGFRR